MKEIDILIHEARHSMGDYCINTCKSQCCRKGFLLLLSEDEVDIVCPNNKEELLKDGILGESDLKMGYKLDFSRYRCPHLNQNWECLIHTQKRPRVCIDFPIFKSQGFYIFADICPAIKGGLLDDYRNKIEKLGFKVL